MRDPSLYTEAAPKSPRRRQLGGQWVQGSPPSFAPWVEAWLLSTGGIRVLSAVEWAEFHGRPEETWHLSIAGAGMRATDLQVALALRDFDMRGAEEDNHQPGVARNFWRLTRLAPGDLQVCDCKSDETTVVEHDGFTWQRPREGHRHRLLGMRR